MVSWCLHGVVKVSTWCLSWCFVVYAWCLRMYAWCLRVFSWCLGVYMVSSRCPHGVYHGVHAILLVFSLCHLCVHMAFFMVFRGVCMVSQGVFMVSWCLHGVIKVSTWCLSWCF